MRILVLGGGVVGVTTAYQLLQDGHEVVLLERHPDVAQIRDRDVAGDAGVREQRVAPSLGRQVADAKRDRVAHRPPAPGLALQRITTQEPTPAARMVLAASATVAPWSTRTTVLLITSPRVRSPTMPLTLVPDPVGGPACNNRPEPGVYVT